MRPNIKYFEGLLDGRLRRPQSLTQLEPGLRRADAAGSDYRRLATKVEESLRFMRAIGVDTTTPEFTQSNFYTAHECLLLPYEQAMTREDSTTGRWYDCSAHLLWVGERTRQPGLAHFEFVRGIQNPVGVKISDKASPDDVIEILDTFNPKNVPGKVTLITRMSADKLRGSTYLLS